jgi:hypothetical protein
VGIGSSPARKRPAATARAAAIWRRINASTRRSERTAGCQRGGGGGEVSVKRAPVKVARLLLLSLDEAERSREKEKLERDKRLSTRGEQS